MVRRLTNGLEHESIGSSGPVECQNRCDTSYRAAWFLNVAKWGIAYFMVMAMAVVLQSERGLAFWRLRHNLGTQGAWSSALSVDLPSQTGLESATNSNSRTAVSSMPDLIIVQVTTNHLEELGK